MESNASERIFAEFLVRLVLATINKLSERMLRYFAEETTCVKDNKIMWFYAWISAYFRVLSQVFCCVIISFIIVNMNNIVFLFPFCFIVVYVDIKTYHSMTLLSIFFLYFINIILKCKKHFFSQDNWILDNVTFISLDIFEPKFLPNLFMKILFEDMQKYYAILWNQIKKILCSSHCCLTFIAYDI